MDVLVIKSRLKADAPLTKHAEDVRAQVSDLLYGVLQPARKRPWWHKVATLCAAVPPPLPHTSASASASLLHRDEESAVGWLLPIHDLEALTKQEVMVEMLARDGPARRDVVLMVQHAQCHGIAISMHNVSEEPKVQSSFIPF